MKKVLPKYLSFNGKKMSCSLSLFFIVNRTNENTFISDMFLKFNIETKTITMHERQARSPLYLFQKFVDRGHVLPQVDINAFSDEVRTLSFVPLDGGEDDDSDDDNLDDDSDDNVV